MKFYLGTHRPTWLWVSQVPLFVSRRTLGPIKRLPQAQTEWALDSGGFTELSMHGSWLVTPAQYVAEVRRIKDSVGKMEWAAPQDWMCEPVITKKTGLTVEDHQRKTIENYLELKSLAPDLPFIPVVQGWTPVSYLEHVEQYDRAGIRLSDLPLVGVGTVCRRQGSIQGSHIVSLLHAEGIRIHGFGVKITGLKTYHGKIASSDSLAWSYAARRNPPIDGHDKPGDDRRVGHKNCANCYEYAMRWREQVVSCVER